MESGAQEKQETNSPPLQSSQHEKTDQKATPSSATATELPSKRWGLWRPRKKSEKIDKSTSLPEKEDSSSGDPFAHLPDHEAAVLRKQLDIPPVQVGYFTLFRYATRNDIIIMIVSGLCAIVAGAAMPLMTVVFGALAKEFRGFFEGTTSQAEYQNTINRMVLYFIYLGLAEFFTIYVSTVGFIYVGEHMSGKIRQEYLSSVLRQNIGYFDKLGAGEITTRITSDTNLVQDGISEKVGLLLTSVATFFAAYVIAFFIYWKLALILTSSVAAIAITMGIGGTFIVKYQKKSLAAYAEGGTVAEEVISSIRNATAFGTQDKLARQYDVHLTRAERPGYAGKAVTGVFVGFLMSYVYLTYALAVWQGSRYLVAGTISFSDVLIITLVMIIGAFSLGNVAPYVQSMNTAVAAGSKIFATIDRVSPLDPRSEEGQKPETVDGALELRNVKHIYPSRPEVVVMDHIDLLVPAGKTTALVGASGSGKSTIVGLVERFYDPVGGELLLDGIPLHKLNLRWLRQQISLVSQEPTLFATTIFDNIAHGLIGTDFEGHSAEDNRERVEHAAQMANAHDFIVKLPEGYQTNVGERGFLISGGQKQRIAIARAIISDPKILLLDEATSALDSRSEGIVQAALDKAAQGRTTIVIAHRLSTIKHADNIVVMSEGRIVEQGRHDALLEQQGDYYNLVEAQGITQTAEQTAVEEEESDFGADEKKSMRLTRTHPTSENGSLPDIDPDDLALGKTQTNKSVTDAVVANQATADGPPKYSLWTLIKVVTAFNKPEWPLMTIALIATIIAGAGNPVQAVFFAKAITALSLPSDQFSVLRSRVNFWSWMYFMLGMSQLVSFAVHGVLFAKCSERLVHRARDRSFRAILHQDIAFFDQEANTAGALTSFLSTETTHLAGISGVTLGTILQVLTSLVVASVLALAVGWKLGLACIAVVPIVLACGFLRLFMLGRFQARAKRAYERSASYACEATAAIRTVASLTREREVWGQYHGQIVAQEARSLRAVMQSAVLYAASQSFMFLAIALGFWYGGTLIGRGEYSLFQFFLCFNAVIFGSQSAGALFSLAPDMSKSRQAASEMKTLFDRRPKIDSRSSQGVAVPAMHGRIEFRDVHFRYPTRLQQPVLRGLNLDIQPGQYIALVGPSGCGKSTTISLLERFYDPLVGGIFVDGHEISCLNLRQYRSRLALVSQEPTLYQGTLRDNLLLGADTDAPDADTSDDALARACREANIHDFVASLPSGLDTMVGSKGTMLSGGQKQRIALARALLRDPAVLLLDEATSALDSESERVVQAALDAAAQGRTTVAVAHRLSSIQNADVIFVLDQGRVVERGTHTELMRKGGRYSELVKLQSLGRVA